MSIDDHPIYVISHRCNDTEDIKNSLSKGANALEIDVRYDDGKWYVDHDGVHPWSTKLVDWLTEAKAAAVKYPLQFALIIFDIKTPNKIESLLNTVQKYFVNSVNILLSIADYDDRSAFDPLVGKLSHTEGLSIDFYNYPNQVQSYFKKKGLNNFWYGNGIATVLPGPNVRKSLVEAAKLRDADKGIKKIYVWTLEKEESIKDYLENVKVDALMINEGDIEVTVIIVNQLKGRMATRSDKAFSVFHPI